MLEDGRGDRAVEARYPVGALREIARLRTALEEIVELPTTPVSDLGGIDESVVGMAVRAGRLQAAAIAARALMPGDEG